MLRGRDGKRLIKKKSLQQAIVSCVLKVQQSICIISAETISAELCFLCKCGHNPLFLIYKKQKRSYMEHSASGKANFALYVVLLLPVYRPGWRSCHVNACHSPLPPFFRTISPLPLPTKCR